MTQLTLSPPLTRPHTTVAVANVLRLSRVVVWPLWGKVSSSTSACRNLEGVRVNHGSTGDVHPHIGNRLRILVIGTYTGHFYKPMDTGLLIGHGLMI